MGQVSGESDAPQREGGISWLVEKIRRGERIEEAAKEPLFEEVADGIPLFLQAAMLDSLHDMWRLNSQKLIYRLGVIMGHKLRVELGEKLDLEEVGTWEATIEQVRRMLELFSDKATVGRVSRLYARFETEGCPCKKMTFALEYCPQDVLIEGIMAGFAQQTLDDPRIFCKHKLCVKRHPDKEVCVHELRIKEED